MYKQSKCLFFKQSIVSCQNNKFKLPDFSPLFFGKIDCPVVCMVFNFLCFRYYKSCFVNFFLCVFYSHVHTRYYETSISKSLKINGGAHVCFVSGIPCVQIDFACITKPFSLIPCNGCFKTSSKISMENIGSYHSAFLDLGNANDLFIYNPIWTFFERVILILKIPVHSLW